MSPWLFAATNKGATSGGGGFFVAGLVLLIVALRARWRVMPSVAGAMCVSGIAIAVYDWLWGPATETASGDIVGASFWLALGVLLVIEGAVTAGKRRIGWGVAVSGMVLISLIVPKTSQTRDGPPDATAARPEPSVDLPEGDAEDTADDEPAEPATVKPKPAEPRPTRLAEPGDGTRREETPFAQFWPGKVIRSARGYLTSQKHIPLRAIARRPDVPLFGSSKTRYPQGVVGIMRAWFPYYVFARDNRAMHIGESPRTDPAKRVWVRAEECFCWTTRECISIERPSTIYATLADAKAKRRPVATDYVYPYGKHFVVGTDRRKLRVFEMAALPVLARVESIYWCFVRPEGTAQGYQVCWATWDTRASRMACRIRASRRELEEYLAGIRFLMIQWKNPEKRTDAKRGLYDHGEAHLTRAETFGRRALRQIRARREGIPKLTGYLAQPIENPLEYERISRDAVVLLRISSQADIWDADDVCYVDMAGLP